EVSETLSSAVLRALEGDPERRYVSAGQLAEGLRLGLAGTDVTLALDEELATRRLEQEPATRRMERERRPAQPAPPPRRARAEQPPQSPSRRRSMMRRTLRGIGALIVLVLIAAAVAIGVIAATSKSTGVKLKNFTFDSIQKGVDDIKQNIQDNTK
ncbi:MAG TPA: hypothetical protein VIL53_06240, partial [Solirubrobacterales bacterium]